MSDRAHLSKDPNTSNQHTYLPLSPSEWFCRECGAKITSGTSEYGHYSNCSHRPDHFPKTDPAKWRPAEKVMIR